MFKILTSFCEIVLQVHLVSFSPILVLPPLILLIYAILFILVLEDRATLVIIRMGHTKCAAFSSLHPVTCKSDKSQGNWGSWDSARRGEKFRLPTINPLYVYQILNLFAYYVIMIYDGVETKVEKV